jgi:magnesium transporter
MNRDKELLEEFIANHTFDAARLLEQMNFEQVFSFVEKIPADLAAFLFKELDAYLAYKCLDQMAIEKSAEIIELLPVNNAASILRRMNILKRKEILEKSEKNISRMLTKMLYSAEDTAGALMDPQVPVISEELNVKEVLERIKKGNQQSLKYLYVTNPEGKLSGIVRLEDLITAESKEKITNVMNSEFPHLYSEVEVKVITDHPGWLKYSALPVLDRSGVFLGVLNQTVIKKVVTEQTQRFPKQAVAAGNALGELYKIGLMGLLKSALSGIKQIE